MSALCAATIFPRADRILYARPPKFNSLQVSVTMKLPVDTSGKNDFASFERVALFIITAITLAFLVLLRQVTTGN